MTAPYTGYELKEGTCLEDIEAYCSHLTADGSFNDDTVPKGSTVERWITTSHHWIAGILAKNGYEIVQTDAEVLGILQELNALDVAIKIELAHPLTGTGEPNERFIELKARRDMLVEMIEESQVLTALGADEAEVGSDSELLAISGISLSRKRSVENNSDYVQPRFKKGFGRNQLGSNQSRSSDTDYYPVS